MVGNDIEIYINIYINDIEFINQHCTSTCYNSWAWYNNVCTLCEVFDFEFSNSNITNQ